MRLINTATHELCEFLESKIPPFAILSHTWGDEEISFQEMSSPHRASRKGYEKIKQTCRLAQEDGFSFVWIDTCCIDKSSSSELSESINSMFQWYANAAVCYAFLVDLPLHAATETGLPACRWFSRGWTLQELLASKVVKFYNIDWSYRGTKRQFASLISNITGIPIDTLQGHVRISDSSVAARMSWAAHRQTTRVEDMAYCLLGIFNLNMALLYGEGNKAFRRLQEEIIKHSNDLTIFAWDTPERVETPFIALFAPSPTAFAGSRLFISFRDNFANFAVTNKGLLLTGDIPLRVAVVKTGRSHPEKLYVLELGAYHKDPIFQAKDGGIYLRKIGPRLFYRVGNLSLSGFGRTKAQKSDKFDVTDKYILVDPAASNMQSLSTFRKYALHIPEHSVFTLKEPLPGILWDHTDRMFLKLNPIAYVRHSAVLSMLFEGILAGIRVQLVVLCDYRRVAPIFRVFKRKQYRRETAFIFQEKHREGIMSWEDLDLHAPGVTGLKNWVDVKVGSKLVRISALSTVTMMESTFGNFQVASLMLVITEHHPTFDLI